MNPPPTDRAVGAEPGPALPDEPLALGLDAGGTETRWALAAADGTPRAEGAVAGFGAAQLATAEGRQAVRQTLEALAQAVLAAGRPQRVHGGITGYGGEPEPLAGLIAAPLGLPADAVALSSDLEVAYLDLFAPGEGHLVYAGTGSIGAHIDAAGRLHRVGGRGGLLDDGGSGFWIAREALRHVWRREDESPGAWQQSPMARTLLARLGGADWSHTRRFITTAGRGEMGRLALAVAAEADADPVARGILQAAGRELGRLGALLVRHHGPRPLALAGRVFALHPLIEAACRERLAALPPDQAPPNVQRRDSRGHHAAARLAARRLGRGG